MSYVVIGANYGDCGKGLLTDYLTREVGAKLVTRFNGGAQAGHTVISGKRRHVFGHLSAGTFAGADTYLSSDFIVNPYLFTKERLALLEKGFSPAVHAHPYALVTTIYDMAINAAIELQRGHGRHGSCGLGINETVTRSYAGFQLTVDDIKFRSVSYVAELLGVIHREWVPERLAGLGLTDVPEWFHLNTGEVLRSDDYEAAAELICASLVHADIKIPEITTPVIFEGAQGLALDEHLGEFPHVTRSNTGLMNAIRAAVELGVRELQPIYCTRSYLTRHGSGPLPNEGVIFTAQKIEDSTNTFNQWQGSFRYAPLNLEQLRTLTIADLERSRAEAKCAGISLREPVLALTCLDQLGDTPVLVIDAYGKQVTVEPKHLPQLVTEQVGIPVRYISRGPTCDDVNTI